MEYNDDNDGDIADNDNESAHKIPEFIKFETGAKECLIKLL